jgi:uncharacterized protein
MRNHSERKLAPHSYDINGLLALCVENVEWASSGPSDMPTAGIRRGHEQVAQFFKAVNEVFEFQRFEPRQFVAQGEQVVVLGDDTVKVKATGKVVTEEWAHAFTIRQSKETRQPRFRADVGIGGDRIAVSPYRLGPAPRE